VPTDDLIAEGNAAVRRGAGAAARSAFEQAIAEGAGAAALEGLARACYLTLDFADATRHWEEAYAAYRASGDDAAAARVARTLAPVYGSIHGDWAVCQGWLSRAEALAGNAADDHERGWVVLNRGLFEPDRSRKDALFRDALEAARRHGDRDLEFHALAYLGASLVHGDQTAEGMALLDEALAAAAGGEVDDFFVLESIFCQLFSACEHARDVVRADQWIRVGDEIARRRSLPAVSAFCHTHYGGVLTAAGRWAEADAALTEAVQLWNTGQRFGLRGGALSRLADLRARQGRIEEAAQLLDGLPAEDPEVARPLAAVHLARGDTALACEVLDRSLADCGASALAVPLLSLLVEVHIAAGDLAAARTVADRLASQAGRQPDPYLTAVAALARGRVCVAAGSGDATACLREALAGFARAQLPMELARARLALATAVSDTHPDVARAEARTALETFESLAATRDAGAAAALLRSLGARVPAPRPGGEVLTRREAEVLELLGLGLSNPEISGRLFISRKTVEHHVGNILAKLGLRSRAEPAAYATRTKPGSK